MQPDRFTIKSQEAIAAAGSLAERRRNPQVTPEHLLAVLLEQEGGVVAPVLAQARREPRRGPLGGERRARGAADREPGRRVRRPVERARPRAARRRGRDARAQGRVRLDRAHPARARRPSVEGGRRAARPRRDEGRRCCRRSREVRGPHRVTDQGAEDKYRRSRSTAATSPRRPRRASSTRSSAATTRSAASSRSSAAARRTTPSSSASPASARPRSSRASPSASSPATCPSRCATAA